MISRLEEREAGLLERISRLTLTAPFAGEIRAKEWLHPGRWVSGTLPLLTLVEPSSVRVVGLASGQDLEALNNGQSGALISDRGDRSKLAVKVENIGISAVLALPFDELGSAQGGPIAARVGANEQLIPDRAYYRTEFSVLTPNIPGNLSREPGVVVVEGVPRCWLWLQVKRIAAILIRETGF